MAATGNRCIPLAGDDFFGRGCRIIRARARLCRGRQYNLAFFPPTSRTTSPSSILVLSLVPHLYNPYNHPTNTSRLSLLHHPLLRLVRKPPQPPPTDCRLPSLLTRTDGYRDGCSVGPSVLSLSFSLFLCFVLADTHYSSSSSTHTDTQKLSLHPHFQ